MTSTSDGPAPPGGLIVLNRDECFGLLGTTGVGRIAFVGPSGPVIHPVNYLVDEGTIVLRTSPYTMLGEHSVGQVAFEVDELDEWMSRGWSVLITGRSAPIDDPDEAIAIRRRGLLHPWAEGQRNLFVRITPVEISGRRIS